MVVRRPVIGAAAPDVVVLDEHGEPWRLHDHLGRPLLLIFHRHIH